MADRQGRIFVVDDDDAVRSGLTRLLRSVGYEVVPLASAEEFLAQLPVAGVGCVLLDQRMPGMDGSELQRHLVDRRESIPVVFLTAHGDIPMTVAAMQRGAVDFLEKPVGEATLIPAVERALARHRETLELQSRREEVARRLRTVSPRELQVLRCVLTGALNKQIAAHLGIVEKTVKVHRGRALAKLGVTSVADLVRVCQLAGLEPEHVDRDARR